ncbi:hypothetical protein BDB00DRAFT_870963 [Zychaea mexicana]|uniref:uncharacterized protein n=1 Tax=Zychaea mexicana TaxID=64656 RepID=UPI0022FEB161|nr:uncharacterized protein BDB00DRAFT_870963 [Zychaea mexicana]KAI9494974.1 hypothetical protein BDB00DRAFT_870963 [Zychaea mexicana]
MRQPSLNYIPKQPTQISRPKRAQTNHPKKPCREGTTEEPTHHHDADAPTQTNANKREEEDKAGAGSNVFEAGLVKRGLTCYQ